MLALKINVSGEVLQEEIPMKQIFCFPLMRDIEEVMNIF